ncbi:hypothetical protein HDU98_010774 [Podochytrium sp. JEL0797]|nr:hypothetical protein HDU98_010774 [Podochytrium sp. JEL0797]
MKRKAMGRLIFAAPTIPEFRETLSSLVGSALLQVLTTLLPTSSTAALTQRVQINYPSALIPDCVLGATHASWMSAACRQSGIDVGYMFKIVNLFEATIATGEEVVVKDVEDLKRVLAPVEKGFEVPFAACCEVMLVEGTPVFGFFKSDAY